MKTAARKLTGLAVLGVILGGSACAPRPAPVGPAAPRYPDFVYPAVGSELASAREMPRHEAAWQALQRGDLATAERDFAAILSRDPGFYPAETGLGYVALARSAVDRALAHFDAALARAAGYAPALAGRGEALVLSERLDEALASFEAALAADASLAAVRRRADVVRLRTVEADVARARQAAQAGRYEAAREAYERALARSPESGFLYRELALVERGLGRLDLALAHARRSVELDPADARAFVALGEVLAARGDYAAAAEALERAAAIEPTGALAGQVAELRARARLAGLPGEFQAIAGAPVVTRGDLAALVAVHLGELLDRAPRRDAVFIGDTRGHWAAAYILATARAGVMEVYPNYTFQPSQPVTRGDLALVVSRLLALVATVKPALAERWKGASVKLADVPPSHLSYPAVAAAVASGVIPPLADETFQLTRQVSGAEAKAVIERVGRLLGGSP